MRDELIRAAGKNLSGLLIYGGLARGRFRAQRSDINVVVVLNDMSADTLGAVAPVMRAAWRAARVEPMFLTPSEVRSTAAAFPTKFLDIKEQSILLTGVSPFAELEIPREHIRLRVEQSLRNSLLRLRRRFLAIAGDPAAQALALVSVARPLALDLGSLLRLAAKGLPAQDRSAAIFDGAAQAFDLDREALKTLAEMREADEAGTASQEFFGRILKTLACAADVAARV